MTRSNYQKNMVELEEGKQYFFEKYEKMQVKIGKLYKENEELKAKHIKSMMFECEKSKLEREIMNKLMIEQSNTILQLKREIGRLKNRNKKLTAKINDLYNDMME